ncbi:glycoside hydrolase domain-containing protein [Kribbella sp. NPDC051587]|uniref:glycoside hydrolase domain-containing protein n=1 Tax=Kribbella sp. NPDC051587 TaxID=3364119 RepID=UPI003792153C
MRWTRAVVAGVLLVTSVAPMPMAHAREAAGAIPGMWTETAYSSVFKDSGRSADAGDSIRLDTAKNDYEGAQIVLRGSAGFTVNSVDFTPLSGSTDAIAASEISYNPVGYEYLNHNSVNGWEPDNFVVPTIRKGAGEYPDRLLNAKTVAVPANQTQSIWVRVHVPATAAGGVYTGRATVKTTNGDLSVPITVNARNVVIPPANQSEFTNVMWTNFLGFTSWDHGKGDTVDLFYEYKRYTPDWWQLIDNWADVMKQNRQNNLQLPLITLLTDGGSKVDAAGKYTFNFSRFDEVVQRFLDKGVVHTLEGFTGAGPQREDRNPYFPQWLIETVPKATGSQTPDYMLWKSPEANNWYSQFYPALKQHLDAKGWTSKYWMHVGDEANGKEGEEGWTGIAAQLRKYFPGVRLGDTSVNGSGPLIAKNSDIEIPNLFTYTMDPGTYDTERKDHGKPLWFYNCNIPAGNHLNRFIDQPQWSQRQTMWLAYNKGATGYLHWAYGNWQFDMNDQDVKGDGYIVRPDKPNHTIESSTRYESLRDGMEDWEVLNKLGKTNPGLAHDLANSVVQASDTYTPDVNYMQRVRRIALDAAAGLPVTAKDLARAKTATASSGDAAKAVDGDSSTAWQPTSGNGTNWTQVDLGRQAQVDGVRLKWGATWASNYRVLTSFDGTKWAEAGTRVDNPKDDLAKPGGDDFVGLNVKARYVRVEATTSSGGATPYQLLDFEVAGNLLLQQNIAGGKSTTHSAPSGRFPDSGNEATDGVLSDNWGDGKSFGYELSSIGSSIRPSVTIDLGYSQAVGTVRFHAYQEYPDYRPDMITVETSNDGTNYSERGRLSFVNGASNLWYDLGFAPATARYIRVSLDKKMNNKYQTGLFVDEIEAYGAGQPGDVTPGSTAYRWDGTDGGHQVIFAPTATGSMGRFDWSAAPGLRRDDLGGGPIAGKTSGYAWYNQQHAVARSTTGKLLHWWWIEGESASHTADWGGDAAGDPTAVVWSGQQHIFARSSTGDLTHWWWDPADSQLRIDKWGGAPGPIVGTPSTYVWGNQLHVVARGANNHLYHWWWVSGEFEPHFADWGGEAYSDPTTFVWNGQQHVFTQAADGQLFHWFWDAGSGLNQVKWGGAPGKFVGAPSSFKTATQQHVVARGPNNTLYHWWWDQGLGVVQWEDRGGEVYSDPVAFAYDNQHQYFAQSKTNTLAHWWWVPGDPNNGWHYNDWGGSVKYPAS